MLTCLTRFQVALLVGAASTLPACFGSHQQQPPPDPVAARVDSLERDVLSQRDRVTKAADEREREHERERKRERELEEERHDHVAQRLAMLEARIADLQAPRAPTGLKSMGWSCAAKCLKEASCMIAGSSNLAWSTKTSTGDTAAAAFEKLTKQCDGTMFIDGDCRNGSFVRVGATITNACVRN